MPINFPTVGLVANVTTYTFSGRTWIWTGSYWQSVGTSTGVQGLQGLQGNQGVNYSYNVDGGSATSSFGGVIGINAGNA